MASFSWYISLMQTTIIKSNRLRDSWVVDTIWVGFNNAVRDSFSRLSLPSPDISLDLGACATRSRTFSKVYGHDFTICRTTSGDASRLFSRLTRHDWRETPFLCCAFYLNALLRNTSRTSSFAVSFFSHFFISHDNQVLQRKLTTEKFLFFS